MQTISRLFALSCSLASALAEEQMAAPFSLPVQTGSFIFALPSSQAAGQPRPPRPPRVTRSQLSAPEADHPFVLPIPAEVGQLDADHTLFVPVGYRAPQTPPVTPAQAASAARAERAIARAQRQRLQSTPYLPPANLLMNSEPSPALYQTPYVASIFRYGDQQPQQQPNVAEGLKEEETKEELQEVKESTPAPVAEGAAAAESSTVYERPVIVEKHGGPLVIIQQGREPFYMDSEQGSEGSKANELSASDSSEQRNSAPAPHAYDRYAAQTEQSMKQPPLRQQSSEPVEYVPYAVISRDGRIALLERSPAVPGGAPAARKESFQSEQQYKAKADPVQRSEQQSRGNYYDTISGQQPRGFSTYRESEETPKESYGGTSVVIRMPSDDGAEWNPSAMLLGKAAHLRRAKELAPAAADRDKEPAEEGGLWHPIDSTRDLED